jgi:hypothetical protein
MGALSENTSSYSNSVGLLRVAPWYFTTIPGPIRLFSTPTGTLGEVLRKIMFEKLNRPIFFRPIFL